MDQTEQDGATMESLRDQLDRIIAGGGGPAFPQWDGHAITSEPMYLRGGMSLRDWFAGKALQGILANPAVLTANGNMLTTGGEKSIPQFAYSAADGMLAARGA